MKKIVLCLCICIISVLSFGQYTLDTNNEPPRGFKRDHVFIGGGIGLGLGGWNGGFNVGANPEIGYSLANWIDVGISANVNYFAFRAEINNGIRQRSFNYGGGVFTRVYPFRGFFIQALPEYNFINTNLKDERFGGSGATQTIKQEAPSLLLGVGYGTRIVGQSNFFTVIMFDAGDNLNSPYVGFNGSKLPIVRAGFNFYLTPKRK